jgi:hypothetical protein
MLYRREKKNYHIYDDDDGLCDLKNVRDYFNFFKIVFLYAKKTLKKGFQDHHSFDGLGDYEAL